MAAPMTAIRAVIFDVDGVFPWEANISALRRPYP